MLSFRRSILTKEAEMFGEVMSLKRYLWANVIKLGKLDLRSKDEREVVNAAKYFFVESDDRDLRSFDGLCRAHNIDPEKAAKRIWSRLTPQRQQLIKNLLHRRRYKIKMD